jgi:hypothetical protein
MIISISESTEFVPVWRGNRDEPEATQIKVSHKAPTVSIKEKVSVRRFEFDSTGQVSGSFEVDRRKVLQAMITSIGNLAYERDGKEQKIATVDQLFNAPAVFDSLIDELYNYFQDILNEKVDEKN